MPEVGVKGQEKLADSKVLCIGAGGLGSPLALYLASAGIGTIGIVDFDVVDLSNLQRQILHAEDRVGDLKVESAKKRLLELNSDINVNTYNIRLTSDNALDLFKDYDVGINVPLSLSMLFVPTLLHKMFPFIILFSGIWFFLKIKKTDEIIAMKVAGMSNLSVIFIPSILSLILGIFLLL